MTIVTSRLHWRRFSRRILWIAFIALLVPLTVVLLLIVLSRSSPDWWSPVDPRLPATRAQAEVVENSFLSQVSLVRPSAPSLTPDQPDLWSSEDWRMSLKAADANAWLAARLPRWLANQLRAADASVVPLAQVRFLEDRVSLAFELTHSGRRQIVAFSFTPVIDDDGALWAREPSVSAGRVTLPAAWSQTFIDLRSSPLTRSISDRDVVERLSSILSEAEPLLPDASITLDDGRRVRLLELSPQPDRLIIRCRTEKSVTP